MLIDARTRHSRKKITRATATTLKTSNSLMSNPEVEAFYDKLSMITEELPQTLFNPLNLIYWERTKYRPTESENRIRIQNRISLKRAADQKIRPRVKPIKRVSQSVELLRNEPSLSYLEFYQQFLKSQSYKNSRAEEPESEQEQPLDIMDISSRDEGFRFKNQLKKYNNVASFIEEKVQSKISQDKMRKPSSKFNRSPATKNSNTSKAILGKNEAEQLKINSILKKWKPASKVDRRFEAGEGKSFQRRRYSCKDVSKPVDLLMDTYRQDSQGTNSDYLQGEKKQY